MAEGTENIAIGSDQLSAAAAPLLQLMARLRNTANPPDAGDLRDGVRRHVEARGLIRAWADDELGP